VTAERIENPAFIESLNVHTPTTLFAFLENFDVDRERES